MSSGLMKSSSSLEYTWVFGKKVSYQIREKKGGPVVLLCPGFLGGFLLQFGHVIDKLGEKFTIVAWDPPGYGFSQQEERPFNAREFSLISDAKYGLKLMELLGYDKFAVVGLSYGGVTTAVMAGTAPQRVSKLVLCNSVHSFTEKSLPGKLTKTWEDMKKGTIWDTYAKLYGKPLMDFIFKTHSQFYDNEEETLISEKLSRIYKRVSCEALYFCTPDDEVAGEHHVARYKEDIPHITIYTNPEGGHYMLNFADEFVRKVSEFLLTS